MTVLVAVLGARSWPYPRLVKTIKRTWASVQAPGVQTLFYYGGAPQLLQQGSDIFLPVDDDLRHTGRKTIAFFDWALQNVDFDVLFRTNCSSYVDLPGLHAYAELEAQPSRYYAGVVGKHEGEGFASGSGYFLSRDLVRVAADDRDRWDDSVLDDVALSRVLRRHGVEPVPLPRRDYASAKDVDRSDTSYFHFRCKSGQRSRQRYGDVRTLVALHHAFLRSRGEHPGPGLLVNEFDAVVVERAAVLTRPLRSRLRR